MATCALREPCVPNSMPLPPDDPAPRSRSVLHGVVGHPILARMSRTRRLCDLTALGTDNLSLADAARFPERARAVEASRASDGLRKIRRVMRLDLGGPPPPWLKELRHLRSLTLQASGLKKVPSFIFELPKLTALFLGGTGLTSLEGIERASNSLTVVFDDTPLGEDDAAIDALVARVPGLKRSAFLTGVELARPTKPVRGMSKAALVKALQNDTLDDDADLRGVDLSGATFEDAFIRQDLRKANLQGTTWKRCDFEYPKMSGANLSGALFEDCSFESTAMDRVKAQGITFRRCDMDVKLEGADVRDARFVELEYCPRIDLRNAKASKMQLNVHVLDESEINVEGKGADLRGAQIVFDLEADRRAELTKKPNPRLKWATGQFSGAKQDKDTQIVYTPLPGAKPAKSEGKGNAKGKGDARDAAPDLVDEAGARAESLGRIDAINAALWFIVMDAEQVAPWRGEDPAMFDKAMEIESGAIKIGGNRGLVCQLGDCGWSYIWRIEGGIALVEHRGSGHFGKMPEAKRVAAMGARVAQLPIKKKVREGKVTVTSGCLALLLPYTSGSFTPKQLAAAKSSTKALVPGGDRALVPMKNGEYEVLWHQFGPTENYTDELGQYGCCLRIVRVGGAATSSASKKESAPAKASVPKKASGARRFELVEGSSSKFWEINRTGASFTTRYGRLGTEGQSTVKKWDSDAKASNECDKLIAEKTKKGYVEKRG